jgi:hypothetical protein
LFDGYITMLSDIFNGQTHQSWWSFWGLTLCRQVLRGLSELRRLGWRAVGRERQRSSESKRGK